MKNGKLSVVSHQCFSLFPIPLDAALFRRMLPCLLRQTSEATPSESSSTDASRDIFFAKKGRPEGRPLLILSCVVFSNRHGHRDRHDNRHRRRHRDSRHHRHRDSHHHRRRDSHHHRRRHDSHRHRRLVVVLHEGVLR